MRHVVKILLGVVFATSASVAAFATPSFATPVALTLLDTPSYQQQMNSPCVIGNPSCHNPPGFSFTMIPNHDSADTLSSPTYTVAQLTALAGEQFYIGIDVQEPGTDPYVLNSFTLKVNGVVQFQYTGPTNLYSLNHGNGFSDYYLSGFNLLPFAGTSTLVFTARFSNADAEREQYFVIPGASTTAVPEPASAALLLVGAGSLALRRRKVR